MCGISVGGIIGTIDGTTAMLGMAPINVVVVAAIGDATGVAITGEVTAPNHQRRN
jgi:hypothetical protein